MKTLINELHAAFKVLYTDNGSIPYLSSCIKDIIKTAIKRYAEAGLIEVQTYASNTGSRTTYLSSPVESTEKVNTLI